MVGTPKTAPRTGLRRVSWVRIVVGADGAQCEVMGIGHRLPTVRQVSLDTALGLAASGVPTVVRSAGAASDQALAAR